MVKELRTCEPLKVKVACFFKALKYTYLMPECQRPESWASDYVQQLAWLVRCHMLIGLMF